MVDSSNLAQGTLEGMRLQDLSMDAMISDGKDNHVINVNLESPHQRRHRRGRPLKKDHPTQP